jgi:hypothetical protein
VLDAEQARADLPDRALAPDAALLLLDADGTELARWSAERSSAAVLRGLEENLSGPAALARIRDALATRGDDDYFTRERLARALARSDRPAEATREFAWCVRAGLETDDPVAIGRRRLLYKAFAELAAEHRPARAALDELRDAIERRLLETRDDRILARDYAELNHWLDDDARTVALFDRFRVDDAARRGLFDRACEPLVAARRYGDVLLYIDPLAAFRGETRLVRSRAVRWAAGADLGVERGARRFAVQRGAALLEALLGTGRRVEGAALLAAILRFDRSPETVTVVRRHLERVDQAELLAEHGVAEAAANPGEGS